RDRHWHELARLVARVPEHHSLIAGALIVPRVDTLSIDSAGDVGRLLLDRGHDRAGLVVEAHVAVGVPNLLDGFPDDLRVIDLGRRGDLTRDQHEARLGHRFASDATTLVLRDDRIE